MLLRDISLQVGTAELVLLVGPSGSGKSTLLMLLGVCWISGQVAGWFPAVSTCGGRTLRPRCRAERTSAEWCSSTTPCSTNWTRWRTCASHWTTPHARRRASPTNLPRCWPTSIPASRSILQRRSAPAPRDRPHGHRQPAGAAVRRAELRPGHRLVTPRCGGDPWSVPDHGKAGADHGASLRGVAAVGRPGAGDRPASPASGGNASGCRGGGSAAGSGVRTAGAAVPTVRTDRCDRDPLVGCLPAPFMLMYMSAGTVVRGATSFGATSGCSVPRR